MVELIWNSDMVGTALAPSGASVDVGEQAALTPEDLICMAASSCLMRSLLRVARMNHHEVLSYASTSRMDVPHNGTEPAVRVHAYVVASPGTDEATLQRLCLAGAQTSPVAQLLGDRLRVTCDVRLLGGAAPVIH